jgi:SAM-dependent methyltransferase
MLARRSTSVDDARLDVPPVTRDRRSFDEIFSRIARSDTLATIWYEAYGDDYPEEASPFSFVTAPELISMGRAMAVSEGQRFVDIACGQGGPSLFVARVTGAAVVGIDSSYVAAKVATATAGKRNVADKARFIVADAAATGVQAASMHGALSIDALQLMPHRDAVLLEVSRILKPGGRFAFSTWLARQPGKGPPFPADYGPLLAAAGIDMESCHEPPDWERRELSVFALIRENVVRLRAELGDTVASGLATEAEKMPEAYPLIRRVNIVGRKLAG